MDSPLLHYALARLEQIHSAHPRCKGDADNEISDNAEVSF